MGESPGTRPTDGKIKAPTVVGRMWLVGLDFSTHRRSAPAGAFAVKVNDFNDPSAVAAISRGACSHDDARRRPACPARPHPPRQPGRQASKDLRQRGDAGREEGRPSRQHVRPERRLCGTLYVRARPTRRPVPVDPAPRSARRHHDADRPPSGIEVLLGAAVEACRLSQARRCHPGRCGRQDVRRPVRRRRHQGIRRALRGRPPSLPVHGVPRGRGRDGRSSRLHPRADG